MFAKVHNLELSATNLDLEISTYSKLLLLNWSVYTEENISPSSITNVS